MQPVRRQKYHDEFTTREQTGGKRLAIGGIAPVELDREKSYDIVGAALQ